MNDFVIDVYPKNIKDIKGAIILRYILDSEFKDSAEYCKSVFDRVIDSGVKFNPQYPNAENQ